MCAQLVYSENYHVCLLAVVVATEMTACSYDPYYLGLCEWTDCPGALQLEDTSCPTYPLISTPPPHSPPTTSSLSSHCSLSIQPESTRFSFATEEELSTFAKGLVPEILQHSKFYSTTACLFNL